MQEISTSTNSSHVDIPGLADLKQKFEKLRMERIRGMYDAFCGVDIHLDDGMEENAYCIVVGRQLYDDLKKFSEQEADRS